MIKPIKNRLFFVFKKKLCYNYKNTNKNKIMAEKFWDFWSSFGDNSTSNKDKFDSWFDTFDEISQEVFKSPLESKLQNAWLTQLEKIDFKLVEISEEYLNNDLFINKLITLISKETVLIDNKVLNKLLEQLIKEETKLKTEENKLKTEENTLKTEKNEDLNTKKLEFFKLSDSLVKELNLESNPNYGSWKQKATSNLLSSNPELKDKPEELESLIKSYILLENREELSKNNPELKEKLQSLANLSLKTEYSKVFESIFQSENWKVVDTLVNKKNWFTSVENDIAKASIIPDWNKAKIEWNNIISYSWRTEDSAQIIELRENDLPKKYISKYWYKLETTQTFTTDATYQLEKQKIKSEYLLLDNNLINSKNTLDSILNKNPNWLNDWEMKDFLNLYLDNTNELNNLNKNDDLYELKKETLTNQINEVEDKIKNYVQKLNESIIQTQEQIKIISNKANLLQETENNRLIDYRNIQLNSDKKAEGTLDFLNNLWLTVIPQEWLEKLFERLNIEQNLDPRLNLNDWFEWTIINKNSQKDKIFNIFSKLYEKLWIDINKIDKTKIINWSDQLLKNKDFELKLKQLIFNENGFDFFKTLNILNSNTEKKEKTPNKIKNISSQMMYA